MMEREREEGRGKARREVGGNSMKERTMEREMGRRRKKGKWRRKRDEINGGGKWVGKRKND